MFRPPSFLLTSLGPNLLGPKSESKQSETNTSGTFTIVYTVLSYSAVHSCWDKLQCLLSAAAVLIITMTTSSVSCTMRPAFIGLSDWQPFIYPPRTKFTGEKWKLLIQQKPREDRNVHLSEPMLQIRDHYINILVIKNTCNNNHNINSYFEEVKLNYSKCGNGLTSPDRNYHSIGVPEVCVVVSRSDTTCIRM